jgi:hypothetical protein
MKTYGGMTEQEILVALQATPDFHFVEVIHALLEEIRSLEDELDAERWDHFSREAG